MVREPLAACRLDDGVMPLPLHHPSMCPLPPSPPPPVQRTAEDLTAWERLDDVIMGGQSASKLEVMAASEQGGHGGGAVWKGDLIMQVGSGGCAGGIGCIRGGG